MWWLDGQNQLKFPHALVFWLKISGWRIFILPRDCITLSPRPYTTPPTPFRDAISGRHLGSVDALIRFHPRLSYANGFLIHCLLKPVPSESWARITSGVLYFLKVYFSPQESAGRGVHTGDQQYNWIQRTGPLGLRTDSPTISSPSSSSGPLPENTNLFISFLCSHKETDSTGRKQCHTGQEARVGLQTKLQKQNTSGC